MSPASAPRCSACRLVCLPCIRTRMLNHTPNYSRPPKGPCSPLLYRPCTFPSTPRSCPNLVQPRSFWGSKRLAMQPLLKLSTLLIDDEHRPMLVIVHRNPELWLPAASAPDGHEKDAFSDCESESRSIRVLSISVVALVKSGTNQRFLFFILYNGRFVTNKCLTIS